MSTRPHPDDVGMRAVARVRAVREQDSRIGLKQAVQEQAACDAEVERLQRTLQRGTRTTVSSAGAYIAERAQLLAVGTALHEARTEAASARTLVEAATAHWQYDRTRLEAVEQLLERRAEARRVETARKEAAMLDDIAAQRWQRRAAAKAAKPAAPVPSDGAA